MKNSYQGGAYSNEPENAHRTLFCTREAKHGSMMDEVDVDSQIEAKGCMDEFEALQLCLSENDRDWAKCRELVKDWKTCFNEHKKKKKKDNS